MNIIWEQGASVEYLTYIKVYEHMLSQLHAKAIDYSLRCLMNVTAFGMYSTLMYISPEW